MTDLIERLKARLILIRDDNGNEVSYGPVAIQVEAAEALAAQAERIAFLEKLAEDMGTLAQAHRDATVKAEARIAQLEAQLAEQPGMIAGFMRKVAEQFPTHELLYFIGPAWTDDGAALALRFAQAIENGDWRND